MTNDNQLWHDSSLSLCEAAEAVHVRQRDLRRRVSDRPPTKVEPTLHNYPRTWTSLDSSFIMCYRHSSQTDMLEGHEAGGGEEAAVGVLEDCRVRRLQGHPVEGERHLPRRDVQQTANDVA